MKPRIVRAMLMRRSALHPRSKNTPIGGKMMAKMILQISVQVNGIFVQLVIFLVVDSQKINNNGCELQKKTNSELSIQKTIEFEE